MLDRHATHERNVVSSTRPRAQARALLVSTLQAPPFLQGADAQMLFMHVPLTAL